MNDVSGNHHLLRRKGVYYFRRRVPLNLVEAIGQKFIQFSLGNGNHKLAKQLRTLKDTEWDAWFEAAEKSLASQSSPPDPLQLTAKAQGVGEGQVLRLVQDYVERMDEKFRRSFDANPPESEQIRGEMWTDAQFDAQAYTRTYAHWYSIAV